MKYSIVWSGTENVPSASSIIMWKDKKKSRKKTTTWNSSDFVEVEEQDVELQIQGLF